MTPGTDLVDLLQGWGVKSKEMVKWPGAFLL